jgi:uncharacterized membrane protein
MLMVVFISATVSIAVSIDNAYLAFSTIIVGMISMFLIKRSVKDVMVDEMIQSIAQKSALMAYSICIPLLALLSIILMFSNLDNQSSYYYQLGITFSYIVLFNMAAYSFAYYFYKKKYGTDDE